MHCKKIVFLFTVLAVLSINKSRGQNYFMPMNRSYSLQFEKEINLLDNHTHTSIRPLLSKDLVEPWDKDTLKFFQDAKFYNTYVGRKLFSEDLFMHRDEQFEVYINPLFDFHVGRDISDDLNLYTNTRGLWVRGRLGKRITFSSTLRENQARFPHYIDSIGRRFSIIPGQGRVKRDDDVYDYNNVTGSVAYTAGDIFTLQLGHGRNIYGDGYRSLLLSDNSFFYPFFKITTDVWKIKYSNLYTVFQDHTRGRINDEILPRKYGSFHYLDIRIGKRLTLGFFEAIIFSADSNNTRSYDFNYINPIIFLRPVEFSIGSPDNAMVGINWKYKLSNQFNTYGQIMLDEFKLDELKADINNEEQSGWWGNKYGVQFGVKAIEPFAVANLFLQAEYNMVRPYTFQHRDSQRSYSHYNQPLAHPLGANFWEMVFLADYSYRNLGFSLRYSLAKVGFDVNGVNFGQNVFVNYDDRPYEYGHHLLQGDERQIEHIALSMAYLLNPKTNMSLTAEIQQRSVKNEAVSVENRFFSLRFRTAIFNQYYDF